MLFSRPLSKKNLVDRFAAGSIGIFTEASGGSSEHKLQVPGPVGGQLLG
jgi:hypothetical protein